MKSRAYDNTATPVASSQEAIRRILNKYGADGVLFHKNLSCHAFPLRVDHIAARLRAHFGPEFRSVVFEGCQGIRGRFQQHAFDTGVTLHLVER